MGIVVNTNSTSMFSNMFLGRANQGVKDSMQRLSSGFRINSAKDDAAGMQISNQLQAQTRGLGVAIRNANDALSMAQVAEGAMNEQTSILLRMHDLALQSVNGSNGPQQREALDAEMEQLQVELSRISDTTSFGSQKLINGFFGTQAFQIGAQAYETIDVSMVNTSSPALGYEYQTSSTSAIELTGSNKTIVDSNTSSVKDLSILVNGNESKIALDYSMSSEELSRKINSIGGISGVEVEMAEGTGYQREPATLFNGAGVSEASFNFERFQTGDAGSALNKSDMTFDLKLGDRSFSFKLKQTDGTAGVAANGTYQNAVELTNAVKHVVDQIKAADIDGLLDISLANVTLSAVATATAAATADRFQINIVTDGSIEASISNINAVTNSIDSFRVTSGDSLVATPAAGTADVLELESTQKEGYLLSLNSDTHINTWASTYTAAKAAAATVEEILDIGFEIETKSGSTQVTATAGAGETLGEKLAAGGTSFEAVALAAIGKAAEEGAFLDATVYGDEYLFIEKGNLLSDDITSIKMFTRHNNRVGAIGDEQLNFTVSSGLHGTQVVSGVSVEAQNGIGVFRNGGLNEFQEAEFTISFKNATFGAEIESLVFLQDENELNSAVNMSSQTFSRSVNAVNINSFGTAQESLYAIEEAMIQIDVARADLGAIQNRVLHSIANNENIRVNVAESNSRIIDLDFAEESTQLAKMQVLQQTGASMLTQANQISQIAIQLVQG
jgi:flagellin